ncbi:hypothetical protein [Candidatus Pollutiaquabacter sp.]|jgi:hypothetical protein|nr:hypothetical protein [Bacteroidota bacterium]
MQRLSTFNRLFLVFCVLLIAFIIWKVPHETQQAESGGTISTTLSADE